MGFITSAEMCGNGAWTGGAITHNFQVKAK